jgi:hypothetical protein
MTQNHDDHGTKHPQRDERSNPHDGNDPPNPHPSNDDTDWKNLSTDLLKATVKANQFRLDAAGMQPLSVLDQQNPKRDAIHMDLNVDNCTEDKARYFADAYKQLTDHADVISFSEMSHKGLLFLAEYTGYTPIKGLMETKFQQSNCALANPKRIQVKQVDDMWQTAFDPKRDDLSQPNLDAGIAGSTNMRNAVMAWLSDSVAEMEERLLMLHLHSMKFPFLPEKEGEPADSDYFREAQLRALARVLKPLIPAMVQAKQSLLVVGDWNLIFGSSGERVLAALAALGLTLQGGKEEARWTQRMGQRIDGILALLAEGVVIPESSYDVWSMTTNPLDHFGRSFDRRTFMQMLKDASGAANNMNAAQVQGAENLATLQKMLGGVLAFANGIDLMPPMQAKGEGSQPIFTDHNLIIYQVTRAPSALHTK